jgi:hypothetical protein
MAKVTMPVSSFGYGVCLKNFTLPFDLRPNVLRNRNLKQITKSIYLYHFQVGTRKVEQIIVVVGLQQIPQEQFVK